MGENPPHGWDPPVGGKSLLCSLTRCARSRDHPSPDHPSPDPPFLTQAVSEKSPRGQEIPFPPTGQER